MARHCLLTADCPQLSPRLDRRGGAHAAPPHNVMVVCQRTMRYQLLYTLAFLAVLRIMEVFRNILYFRF